ncbi:hypothetical protein I7I51_04702 [Histoplasma capsulatum]|uniref:Uncharacterized protein n=1 Tax=Ajellomyces capsulatus TaxID=5037 RepID=A0A8A1M0C8_AJECA|nr:hypothetical protein I7I51_04702 [Histoplasma capsulatum]
MNPDHAQPGNNVTPAPAQSAVAATTIISCLRRLVASWTVDLFAGCGQHQPGLHFASLLLRKLATVYAIECVVYPDYLAQSSHDSLWHHPASPAYCTVVILFTSLSTPLIDKQNLLLSPKLADPHI